MDNFRGLATGIGSLPHVKAEEALNLIFKYVPQIPFWPQLPKRSIREGMVAQFSEKLPCLKISSQGLAVDLSNRESELEKFYEHLIAEDLDYFRITQDYSHGLYAFLTKLQDVDLRQVRAVKCQVTGPFTFAAGLKDETGKAVLHDPVLFQAMLKGLLMKALWQINSLKKFNKEIIIFIDEPYLGCFGSAYTPINREEVVRVLSEFSRALKAENVFVGVHCCGNTDWSILTEIGSIDLISFDAYDFIDKFVIYAKDLNVFLRRGGMICWGIVPTQEQAGLETPESLSERLKSAIDVLVDKGIDRGLILNGLLISPSCGLGTLNTDDAEPILKLLLQTAAKVS
ncbi:MAG: methionine synthase [Candidatus Omnitrophota bacterium]|jgi:methionine synthase II (cobalamin-independent)|nr:MAG: methionine synthase [Candidatus Omnitrophota bacterium]